MLRGVKKGFINRENDVEGEESYSSGKIKKYYYMFLKCFLQYCFFRYCTKLKMGFLKKNKSKQLEIFRECSLTIT